ncbi:cysteine proteinase [Choiromyces venosus 120613-1]|uniref:ubiquitinyl hydrolase 1 n=1 Tax=Choiromyces venosus 120613-1 TaxID=1336337 RepID=A0A3N4J6K6_9PEZI|nr:cysteine proteinase [Choiromyces venosus 120613-1]
MPRSAVPISSIDPEVSLSLLISLITAGVFVVYILLYELVGLPPLLELIFVMIPGLLLGPRARETLENTFGTSTDGGFGIVARVRNRAASLVGGQLVPAGYSRDGEGLIGGLWNSGNTCYQNSVLQAMASLSHLKPHLASLSLSELEDGMTPSGALISLITDLNTLTTGARASTPSPIIVRGTDNSGWIYNEQQDAQEFFQKLTGSLEKEVLRFLNRRKECAVRGLESVRELEKVDDEKKALFSDANLDATLAKDLRSPFEGLFAQRVGFCRCLYPLRLVFLSFPYLSLTKLSRKWSCSLEECLSEFTAIEKIHEVDCDKCTLLSLCNKLKYFLEPSAESETPSPTLQESTRLEMQQRLTALEQAIDEDNFSPNIPGVKISPKQKISSTKTKQTMIARPPPILVLHLNRSQYDIMTGLTGKNHAAVSFPARLDLGKSGVVTRHDTADGSWGLAVDPARPMSGRVPRWVETPAGDVEDSESADKMRQKDFIPENSPEKVLYELKSVVVHYGGHHNGHYICYRKYHHTWFKTSDHEVHAVDENTVLNIGKVFMLFYERVDGFQENGNAKLGFNPLVNGGLGAMLAANNCGSELDYGIDEDEQRPYSNGTVVPPVQDSAPGSTSSSSSTHSSEITPPASPSTPPDSPVEAREDVHTLMEAYVSALKAYTSLLGTLTSTLSAAHSALSQVETDKSIFETPTTAKIGVGIELDSSFRIDTFSPPTVTEPTTNGVRKRKGKGKEASANGTAKPPLSTPLKKAQEGFTSATTSLPPILSTLQTIKSLEARISSDSEATLLLKGKYKQQVREIIT